MGLFKISVLLIFLVVVVSVFSNEPFFNSASLSVLCDNSHNVGEQKLNIENIGPCPIPVQKLRAARQEPAVIGDYYTEPPKWLNVTLATIGQKFLRKNLVGFLYSSGLTTLLLATSTDVVRVIVSAGNILQPTNSARRYLGTILHILFWTYGDIVPTKHEHDPSSYRWNQSTLFETMNLIRSVHGKISYQADTSRQRYKSPALSRNADNFYVNEPLWEAFHKDLVASPLAAFQKRPIFPPRNGGTPHPFNQFSMLLQYWAYTAFQILKPETSLFMANPSEEELLGYLHFWGFLAHVMGLRPEYNICLQPDIRTAKIYYKEMLEEYFVPGLFQLDYETKVAVDVSTKAFAQTFPFMDDGFMVKQLCQDFLGIETKSLEKVISRQAKLYTSLVRRSRFMMNFPRSNAAVRFVFNGMIQVATIEQFGFNILIPENFTNGIVDYGEKVLKDVNLWKWRDETHTNAIY